MSDGHAVIAAFFRSACSKAAWFAVMTTYRRPFREYPGGER